MNIQLVRNGLNGTSAFTRLRHIAVIGVMLLLARSAATWAACNNACERVNAYLLTPVNIQFYHKFKDARGWLNRSRRLSKSYERTIESDRAFLQIAMIHLMLKRLA